MPYKLPYPELPDLGTLQSGDILPTLRPAFDEGSATIDNIKSYVQGCAIFIANISQAGTSAPTYTIFENTIGPITGMSYDTVGRYQIDFVDPLLIDGYTWMVIQNDNNISNQIGCRRLDDYTVGIRTAHNFTYEDDILNNTSIEIRVYQMPP